jgi:succinyl-diaminopimelate desuccinylase
VTDLLAATAELVAIPSESLDEAAIIDHIGARLATAPWLRVERLGNNLVARTDLGRGQRLVLAGHVDTVPANDNAAPRIDDDVLWGLGSADMKGGVAVFLDLALTVAEPTVDLTYVFYEAEEISLEHNGLHRLSRDRPDLLAADAAVLGEPTGAMVEAGCQGTLRAQVTFKGERAHTARPWMGRNAIHRIAPVLSALAAYEERRPVLDGCEYREAVQAVHVEGGVFGNVVPDRAVLRINHRFAPDRNEDEAVEHVRSLVAPAMDEGDEFEILDLAKAAPPSLGHPLLARLVDAAGPPRAKLGWTDVSFFASAGIPATNYGPGEPTLAHSQDERVSRDQLETVHRTLIQLITS